MFAARAAIYGKQDRPIDRAFIDVLEAQEKRNGARTSTNLPRGFAPRRQERVGSEKNYAPIATARLRAKSQRSARDVSTGAGSRCALKNVSAIFCCSAKFSGVTSRT